MARPLRKLLLLLNVLLLVVGVLVVLLGHPAAVGSVGQKELKEEETARIALKHAHEDKMDLFKKTNVYGKQQVYKK